MDLFDELENLAVSAVYDERREDEDTQDANKGTIKMWQDRFGYTYEEAAAVIGITQTAMKPSTSIQQETLSPAQARVVYLLKLDGPISTPQKVQIAANLATIPESHHGSSDTGDSVFCKVDGRAKIAIEKWLFHAECAPLQASVYPGRNGVQGTILTVALPNTREGHNAPTI